MTTETAVTLLWVVLAGLWIWGYRPDEGGEMKVKFDRMSKYRVDAVAKGPSRTFTVDIFHPTEFDKSIAKEMKRPEPVSGINWPACGTVGLDDAEVFARLILAAVKDARGEKKGTELKDAITLVDEAVGAAERNLEGQEEVADALDDAWKLIRKKLKEVV